MQWLYQFRYLPERVPPQQGLASLVSVLVFSVSPAGTAAPPLRMIMSSIIISVFDRWWLRPLVRYLLHISARSFQAVIVWNSVSSFCSPLFSFQVRFVAKPNEQTWLPFLV